MSRPLLSRLLFFVALASGATADAAAQTPAVAPVIFEAPAGRRIAGPTTLAQPFDRVLPSGRLLHPAGSSVVVGIDALGFAVAPGGRYAVVSNDDDGRADTVSTLDGVTTGGYSLAVVDLATMRVVDRYRALGETFFAGIVACADPVRPGGILVFAAGGPSGSVYAFDLDPAGHLTPDARHAIALPESPDATLALAGKAFPGTLVLAPSGGRLYVVDTFGDDVAQIDVATRAVVGTPAAVGFAPFGATYSSAGLLVANEGLAAYGKARAALLEPPFETPAVDPERASSVSFLTVYNDESLGSLRYAVPLDRGVDGVRAIGGTHPAAIVALHTKPYAFVAMANVDRVATLSLDADVTRAAGGTELRLYDRGPYGTQPVALAVSPDERRLYVALAGIDAIAVLDVTDPLHPHRLGLIATGWYPTALAVSPDGRYLYVLNTKGYGSDRAAIDSNAVWSTFERIDMQTTNLQRTTPLALACLRAIRPAAANRVVPQTFASNGSATIKHVVVVLQEGDTFDAMLGDLTTAPGAPHGPGSSRYLAYDETMTPNLHALARTFGLAGNLYVDGQEPSAGHAFVSGGTTTDFTERTVHARRRSYAGRNQDPEDYPRLGYIFNSLAERGKSFRDYGELVRVSGYDQGEAADPKFDDPYFARPDDTTALTQGLGGRYALDVPALAALLGHIDLNYPGFNARVSDSRRAAEFERDLEPLVRADTMPAFTELWLPNDRSAAAVADGDRALGRIVDYLTHTPQWSSTAIFIIPSDTQGTRDHVDVHRTYAVVVSPYAKRGYVGMRHASTVSVLKTTEELLGLPALSLGDALASDLSDYFTTVPNESPYIRLDAASRAL